MEEMIKQLIEDRARAWEQGKALLDDVATESREMSEEETASWTRINDDIDRLDERIAELTEIRSREAKADETRADYERLIATDPNRRKLEEDQVDEVRQFLEGKRSHLDVSFRGLDVQRGSDGRYEVRDLSVGTATAGAETVPTSFARQLYEYVIESAGIMQTRATVIRTAGGEAMDFPKIDAGGSAALVAEGNAIAESDATTAKTTLNAYKYGQLVQVTFELSQDSGVDILGFVARDAGRAVGDAFGAHAATGTGSGQPNGVMTAGTSNVGGTGQTGIPTADELIDLYYGTKELHARNGEWFMKRSTEGIVRKLKDTTDQYLWQPGLQVGSPNNLLGAPIVQDPNVAAPALNADSVAFGDFSAYYIRMVNGVRFERSDHFAFANDLITFRAVLRADGDLLDPTAIQLYTGAAT